MEQILSLCLNEWYVSNMTKGSLLLTEIGQTNIGIIIDDVNVKQWDILMHEFK